MLWELCPQRPSLTAAGKRQHTMGETGSERNGKPLSSQPAQGTAAEVPRSSAQATLSKEAPAAGIPNHQDLLSTTLPKGFLKVYLILSSRFPHPGFHPPSWLTDLPHPRDAHSGIIHSALMKSAPSRRQLKQPKLLS